MIVPTAAAPAIATTTKTRVATIGETPASLLKSFLNIFIVHQFCFMFLFRAGFNRSGI
jgi:hypothetical protein